MWWSTCFKCGLFSWTQFSKTSTTWTGWINWSKRPRTDCRLGPRENSPAQCTGYSAQCTLQCCTALQQSVDVSPNLCHYLWALCLIRLRRLCWPPCYDTLQYPHVSYQLPMLYNNITIICWPPWYFTIFWNIASWSFTTLGWYSTFAIACIHNGLYWPIMPDWFTRDTSLANTQLLSELVSELHDMKKTVKCWCWFSPNCLSIS